MQTFDDEWQTAKFMSLSFHYVSVILDSDFLEVMSENTIFTAVKAWLSNHPEITARKALELYRCVRW